MESNRLNEPPSFPSYEAAAGGGTGGEAAGGGLSGGAAGGLDSVFVCSVCLDPVKNPVITQCGHLYCWSCLYRWLNTQHSTCPVCKAGVSKENVIPIFIRGCEQDPRGDSAPAESAAEQVPSRPQGRRPEPIQPNNNLFPGDANNIQAQFGAVAYTGSFGFFPSLFGLQFQSFVPPLPTNRALTPDEEHEKFLSKVLLVIGSLVVLCLVFF